MSPLSLAFIIILSIAAGFLLGLLFHIRRTSAEMQRLKEAEVQARTLLESERRHAAENRLTLKNMETGEQQQLSIEEALAIIEG